MACRENYVALKSTWSYKMSNNVLLSNMEADFNVLHNDYRYGIADSSLSLLDTGYVSSNTIIQLRPITHFYGKNEKLQFKIGGELSVDIREKQERASTRLRKCVIRCSTIYLFHTQVCKVDSSSNALKPSRDQMSLSARISNWQTCSAMKPISESRERCRKR